MAVDITQKCLDCHIPTWLIEYVEMSPTQRIYRYYCKNCESAFRLIETLNDDKSSNESVGTPPNA